MPRGMDRIKPVHPLVKRLWALEKYKIKTATEAAQISGESAQAVASTIDVERMNALIERIEHTAEKIGVRPADFLSELLEYIQDQERKIS